ncbi:hypothetical protein V1498_11450 [Peribacillus sp. SCS-26]|uniref:hypothetical protein n=1 Tax=Paraperibacillus marinus TaxID=3115295 RepID=UPI003906093C
MRAAVCLVTLLLMGGVNFGVTLMGFTFLDASFFIGLAFAVLIYFFTSTGGFTSNNARLSVQGLTGLKVEEEKTGFSPSYAFYTAVLYTVVSLIASFIYYKDYFI